MQGDELKALRKRAGMTQQQLADAIGMTSTSIGLMERDAATIEKRTELAVRYAIDHPADVPEANGLIVYEVGIIDHWNGWIPEEMWSAPAINDTGGYSNEKSSLEIEASMLLAQSRKLAAEALGYEGDIRQGPFLSALPFPDIAGSSLMVGWKQDNNGTCYIGTMVPLSHLDREGYSSAYYFDGVAVARR